jgi:outer membrane protein, heavy metal efflux system
VLRRPSSAPAWPTILNFVQRIAPWLLAGASVSASVMAQTATPAPPWLGPAVDAAWARAASAQETRGQERVAVARQTAAGAWIPHAPSVEASRRNGPAGAAETELGLSAPLWMPGQRAAVRAAADADLEVARAAQRAERWRLAGEVREAAWAVAAARAELAAAQEQLRLLQALGADVDRRVQAGDSARADALVARAEMLAAEAAVSEGQQRLQQATARWTHLTGVPVPVDPAEAPAEAIGTLPEHPELAAARLSLERARKRLESLQQSRRDPPEVAVSWRQERAGSGQARQDSVGLALRIPFGTDARSGPQEAAALSEVEVARVQVERIVERSAIDIRTAREALDAAQRQLSSETQRAALLKERAQLLDKSFRAGETSLPDLLRALAGAAQADAALVRQRSAVGMARARLHQSLGSTP